MEYNSTRSTGLHISASEAIAMGLAPDGGLFVPNSLPPLDEQYKTPQNLIEGCQSRVWLHAGMRDGRVHFEGESDAILVRGIVSLLVRVLTDHTPDEILGAELYFIDRIGLHEHLSPTRSNGLLAMVKQMRLYALAFKAASAKE